MWVAVGSGTNTIAYSSTADTPYIHLPFENSTSADVIGNSTMTATGSPLFVTGIRGATALNLTNPAGGTAQQYVTGTWSGATNFTVSLWFNARSIGANQVIFGSYTTLFDIFINSSNQLTLYLPTGTTTNALAITGPTISSNRWYQVTAIFQKASTCSLYVNNTLYGPYTHSGSLPSCTQFCLGTYGNGTFTNAFNGYIDDVKIYHYAVNVNSKITWQGLRTSVFSGQGNAIAWNGTIWMAVGAGTNSIAYSYDGITWIGLGTGIFSTSGNGIAWNGSMWVALGSGANSIAYSYNGIIWVGLGKGIFSTQGNGVAWNGSMWVAVGSGTNSIAYSNDGIIWIGIDTIFTPSSYLPFENTYDVIFGNLAFYSISGSITYSNSIYKVGSYSVYFPNTYIFAPDNYIEYTTSTIFQNPTAFTVSFWMYPDYGYDPWNTYMPLGFNNGTATGGLYFGSTYEGIHAYFSSTTSPNIIDLYSPVALYYTWTHVAFTFSIINGAGVGTLYINGIAVSSGNSIGTGGLGLINTPDSMSRLTLGCMSASGNAYIGYLDDMRIYTVTLPPSAIALMYNSPSLIPLSPVPPIFTTSGNGVAWNGDRWVAMGSGGNTIVYSTNGINWTAAASSCFTSSGNGVTWNGTRWVATGSGTNIIGYSSDGSTWSGMNSSDGSTWNNINTYITPTQTNVASYTWIQDGITWNADSSAAAVYRAFDDSILTTWSSQATYNRLTGNYNGVYIFTNVTAIQGIGNVLAQWLQIQTSSPLALLSYRYGCGVSNQFPKSYYIVGSNDNTTWYPVHYCSMSSNIFTVNNTACSTNISVTLSGSQTSIGGQTVSGTFTTYPSYTSMPYTYFRMVIPTIGTSGTSGTVSAQISELYLNFVSTINAYGSGIAWNNGLGSVNIQHPVVAVGQGTHSLAYSPDGVQWTGLGTSLFSTGYCVCWNGSKWIVGGLAGANTLAYSYDGVQWTGLGTTIFSVQVNGIAWNGTIWVAVGSGLNTIAYSTDGFAWTGSVSGNTIFTTSGNSIAWNGKQWVAVGQGTNSIAYSADGITWTAISSTIFSTQGNSVAWTGSLWVAVGAGSSHTIAYSSNGVSWTGLGTAIFSTSGNGICWNGARWVAVGTGNTHTIAYSANGTIWTGFGKTFFPISCNGVCWTGTRFVAVGISSNPIIYSQDGLTWYTVSSSIFTQGNGVAGNPRIGATLCDSQIALNTNTGGSNTLDIVSDTYCNTGYTNFSATIQTQTYTVDKSSIATVIKTLPGAPTNVSGALYPVGAPIGINVSFVYPTNKGGSVDAYYASVVDVALVQPTVTASSPSQPITITGLVPGTTYQCTVYSSNSAGQSAPAVSASNLLFQVPPSVPQNYSVALDPPTNPTGILVSFTAPAVSGGITSYTVTPSFGSAQTGTVLSYTFTGFTAGTVYTFTSYGTNTGGTGAITSSSITYYTKPDAPTVSSITLDPPATPTGVNVSFTTSSNNGGGTLTYTATAYSGGTAISSSTGAASPLKITGLTKGITYTYSVTATNAVVISNPSTAATLLYQTNPSVPQSVDASVTPNTTTISWSAPSSNGGTAITSYQVVSSPAGYNSGALSSTTTSIVATGLTNGTSYSFTITVTNGGGLSNSTISSAVIPYTTPSAPTGLSAVSGSGQLTLNWTAPSIPNNGGRAISGYRIINTTTSTTNTTASNSYILTGLTNGSSYTFTVAATNDGINYGPTVSGSAIPDVVPGATNVSSTSQGRQSVTLNWTAPVNNGTAIISYDVSSNNGASWTSAGNVLSYTFGGLSGGTYTLKARAVNAAGAGPSGTGGSQTLPAAPTGKPVITNVVFSGYDYFTAGASYTDTIYWNSVPNATGYILYWRDDHWSSGAFDVGNSLSIYISWGRVSENSFTGDSWDMAHVRVVAYNNGGYSPSSDEVNGY